MKDWRTWSWCRRCAVFFVLLALGCGDDLGPEPKALAKAPAPVAKVLEPVPPEVAHQDARHTFYRGYLADVLAGDRIAAASHYQQILGAGAEQPALVAHAALRLAIWAERSGQRDVARDLAVRASVLGSGTPYVRSEAQRLRRRLAASTNSQGGIKVRGPKIGTPLRGVPKAVGAQFAAAEMLLAAYHRIRIKPRIEALSAGVGSKRSAMQRAVSAYEAVVKSGVPQAVVAAEFRIASTYHDYSLALSFAMPDELDPKVATRLLSSLQTEIRRVQDWSSEAYQRSKAAAKGRSGPQVKEWSDAASRGLASVRDLVWR